MAVKWPLSHTTDLGSIGCDVSAREQDEIKHSSSNEPNQGGLYPEKYEFNANADERTHDFGLYDVLILDNGQKVVTDNTEDVAQNGTGINDDE